MTTFTLAQCILTNPLHLNMSLSSIVIGAACLVVLLSPTFDLNLIDG